MDQENGKERDKKKMEWEKVKKDKYKFWLMQMHQIGIFHIFAPNLEKSISLVKNSFFSKTRSI